MCKDVGPPLQAPAQAPLEIAGGAWLPASHRGLASALLTLGWLRNAVDDGSHIGGAIELDLGQATAVGGDNSRDLCGQR